MRGYEKEREGEGGGFEGEVGWGGLSRMGQRLMKRKVRKVVVVLMCGMNETGQGFETADDKTSRQQA